MLILSSSPTKFNQNYSCNVTSLALEALPVCPMLIWTRLSSMQLCDTFCSLTVVYSMLYVQSDMLLCVCSAVF
jgi:hypothetical protein